MSIDLSRLPKEIKIVDVTYTIEYVEKPSDVDIFKRSSLWGQCDFWTRTIRVYCDNRSEEDIRHTLWHEILHALSEKLIIKTSDGNLYDQEDPIDLLATGINTILYDNEKLREINR